MQAVKKSAKKAKKEAFETPKKAADDEEEAKVCISHPFHLIKQLCSLYSHNLFVFLSSHQRNHLRSQQRNLRKSHQRSQRRIRRNKTHSVSFIFYSGLGQ